MSTYSIITVCLNVRKEIERTANSIINQNFPLEWIVIDGGSDDGTIEFLKKIKFPIVIISERDDGIYDAMNKGVAVSTGRYCLFINAGDQLFSNDITERYCNRLDNDIVSGAMLEIDLNKNIFLAKNIKNKYSILFMFNDTLFHPSSFIRRKIFYKNGFYDKKFKICGDRDFFCRNLVNSSSIYFSDFCVSRFYLGGISTTSIGTRLQRKENNMCRERNFSIWYRAKQFVVFLRKIHIYIFLYIKREVLIYNQMYIKN